VLSSIISFSNKRVLVCPLDWGLGHAARCVPLVKQLQAKNNAVTVACTDWQETFLREELKEVEFTRLFGYNVKYSENISLGLKLLSQFPRLSMLVRKEHLWLKNYLKENKTDVVISDNRFGLYNKSVKSIFITHQLFVPAPFLNSAVNKINFSFIKKYDACWVPDYKEEANSLSGELSHGKTNLETISFIAPLSRFENKRSAGKKKEGVLILLSGIEPQRTLLEEKLCAAFSNFGCKITLVRGADKKSKTVFPGNFSVYDTVNSEKLEELLLSSEEIVCRSGYSTLMDLHALGLKALLIPTPGQTEQEYLAELWKEKFGYKTLSQKNLSQESVFTLLDLKENSPLQKQSV